jgi:NAD(P)H-flavin reductase
MAPYPAAVREVRHETHDTVTLTLDPPDRQRGLVFVPGQFMMLYLFGAGEVPISISGDPADPWRLEHTIRAVGRVTRPMRALGRGAVLGVRGPFGNGWPVAGLHGRDLLIIAGGVGLAPLRPLVRQLLNRRDEVGTVDIFYGARSPAELLYREELAQWARCPGVRLSVTVDHAEPGWQGDVGVVTRLLEKTHCNPANTLALLCGPEIMMRFSIKELNELGIGDTQIHVSMERNMQCALGLCGRCQYGPAFVCKDGPVLRFDRIRALFGIREL